RVPDVVELTRVSTVRRPFPFAPPGSTVSGTVMIQRAVFGVHSPLVQAPLVSACEVARLAVNAVGGVVPVRSSAGAGMYSRPYRRMPLFSPYCKPETVFSGLLSGELYSEMIVSPPETVDE